MCTAMVWRQPLPLPLPFQHMYSNGMATALTSPPSHQHVYSHGMATALTSPLSRQHVYSHGMATAFNSPPQSGQHVFSHGMVTALTSPLPSACVQPWYGDSPYLSPSPFSICTAMVWKQPLTPPPLTPVSMRSAMVWRQPLPLPLQSACVQPWYGDNPYLFLVFLQPWYRWFFHNLQPNHKRKRFLAGLSQPQIGWIYYKILL